MKRMVQISQMVMVWYVAGVLAVGHPEVLLAVLITIGPVRRWRRGVA